MRTTMTIVDLARARAGGLADGAAYTYLADRPVRASASLTWGELDRRARAIAVALERRGARGQRVLMLYPPGLEFVEAFLGCLYAGAIAVPAYEPGRVARGMARLAAIAADCTPALVATTTTAAARLDPPMASTTASTTPSTTDIGLLMSSHLTTDDVDTALADAWQRPDIDASTVAFLQYTSGSTATPTATTSRAAWSARPRACP